MSNDPVSDCCHKPVIIKGNVTMYYVCMQCLQPCNALEGKRDE
jgi:hypothetical protein